MIKYTITHIYFIKNVAKKTNSVIESLTKDINIIFPIYEVDNNH